MINWGAHRLWLGLSLLAVLIGVGGTPVLGVAQEKATHQLIALRRQRLEADSALRQLRDDIAMSEKMKVEIDADQTDQVLAPVDRLRCAQLFERRATEAHLSSFSYSLSPEKGTIIETIGAGPQHLAVSQWRVTADVPTDLDAYFFLDALRRSLPGRLGLSALSMQRVGDGTALSTSNLHFTASGEWLSNGASRALLETP